jgi:hypothetical protein
MRPSPPAPAIRWISLGPGHYGGILTTPPALAMAPPPWYSDHQVMLFRPTGPIILNVLNDRTDELPALNRALSTGNGPLERNPFAGPWLSPDRKSVLWIGFTARGPTWIAARLDGSIVRAILPSGIVIPQDPVRWSADGTGWFRESALGGTIQRYSLSSGAPRSFAFPPTGQASTMAFLPNGDVVVVNGALQTRAASIDRYGIASRFTRVSSNRLSTQTMFVDGCTVSPGGDRVAWLGTEFSRPSAWERTMASLQGLFRPGPGRPVPSLSQETLVEVASLSGGTVRRYPLPSKMTSLAIEWTPDGKSICGSDGKRIWLVDVR